MSAMNVTMTRRQAEILSAYAKSSSAKETARDLGISWQTVRNTIYKLCLKYDVHSAIELYVKLGWLQVPGEWQ